MGFIATMFNTFAPFIAPPGLPAPVLWGDERIVVDAEYLQVVGVRA